LFKFADKEADKNNIIIFTEKDEEFDIITIDSKEVKLSKVMIFK